MPGNPSSVTIAPMTFPTLTATIRDGKQEKEQLHLLYDEALTLADEDIDLNWETYQTRFLEGRFP
jgi:hypothetical protein